MNSYYFAYGSNMDAAEFYRRLKRIPTEEPERWAGILHDHELSFSKRSSRDPRVGYATVEAAPGLRVEGVVYRVDARELAMLDRIELVPEHYIRYARVVSLPASGEAVMAECYAATEGWRADGLLPTRAYVARMLRAGTLITEGYAQSLAAHETRTEEGYAPVA